MIKIINEVDLEEKRLEEQLNPTHLTMLALTELHMELLLAKQEIEILKAGGTTEW